MSDYTDMLRDPRWQMKRLEVMKDAGAACERCHDTKTTLNVHHKRYVRGRAPWEYDRSELECLCERCHKREHGKPTEPPRREQQQSKDPIYAEWDAYMEDIDRRLSDPKQSNDALDALVMEKMDLLIEMRKNVRPRWVSFKGANV